MIAFIVIAVFIGGVCLKLNPYAFDGQTFSPPSLIHWLGTNDMGQDVFSQLVMGSGNTLLVGVTAAILSTLLSAVLGLAAGYSRLLDPLLNGLANVLLVLPPLLLVLIVASFSGGGIWQLVITLGLLTWPGYMRLIRAAVLSLREREFVKASHLFGGKAAYILARHIGPHIMPLVRTKFIIAFRQAILSEASLSFLGLGDPNRVTLGKMINQAFEQNATFLTNAWQWTVVPPMAVLMIMMIGLALWGDPSPKSRAKRFRAENSGSAEKERRSSAAAIADEETLSVCARDLSVRFSGRTILFPLDLTVRSGEIMAVIGESGSGKTTLARALYGMLPAEAVEGEVMINDRPVYFHEANDQMAGRSHSAGRGDMIRWKDAAFIFQDPTAAFNPVLRLSVQFDEVLPKRLDASVKRAKLADALKKVGLEKDVLDKYPHELSGGMLARAMIALALLNEPSVLIADEPTSSLDPIIQREVLDLLIEQVRSRGMTMLLITHHIAAAQYVADEIVVLKDGHLIERTDKLTWMHRPREAYSRELKGTACGAAKLGEPVRSE